MTVTTPDVGPEVGGVRPTLEWLRVADLQVDAYVQRSYSDKFARQMAENWNDEKLGMFKASKRENGVFYVTDGQHRRGALLHRDQGERLVPVIVYEGLTIAQEAAMFVADNHDNRNPNPLDVHRLLVVAGEPEAVEIQDAIEAHGLTLAFGYGSRHISAVSALRWIHRTGGAELLDLTLKVVEEAWGTDSRDSRDGTLLKAMGYVLNEAKRSLDVTALADKLGKHGKPGQLIGDARTYRTVTQRSLWMETAHAIVGVYNKNRHSRRLVL